MFRSIWMASAHTRYFLRRYMPTNIALDAMRTRPGLKWGVPAMLVAIPYLYAASLLTVLVGDGAPRWLYLLVLLFIWNALKFAIMGPVSVVLLIGVRASERRERRGQRARADAFA